MSLSRGQSYFSVRVQILSFLCIYLVSPSFTGGWRLTYLWYGLLNCVQFLEAINELILVCCLAFMEVFEHSCSMDIDTSVVLCLENVSGNLPIYLKQWETPAFLFFMMDFLKVSCLHFLMLALCSLSPVLLLWCNCLSVTSATWMWGTERWVVLKSGQVSNLTSTML